MIGSKPKYICIFEFKGRELQAESSEGAWVFKQGFWINGDLQYTGNSDSRFWIPPHKISYIEYVKGE